MYSVTKTYGNDIGISACFRQHRADSHCRFLHGYALGFRIVFKADRLDANNWVFDFGSLKFVKRFLEETFDHKTVVASDDPQLKTFRAMEHSRIIDLVELESVGCEAFARYVFEKVNDWLYGHHKIAITNRNLRVHSVECFEHGSNSATFTNKASS